MPKAPCAWSRSLVASNLDQHWAEHWNPFAGAPANPLATAGINRPIASWSGGSGGVPFLPAPLWCGVPAPTELSMLLGAVANRNHMITMFVIISLLRGEKQKW